MASRKIEDEHVDELGRLLSKSGLKCSRTVVVTPEEVIEEESEEEVEEELEEQKHEQLAEETKSEEEKQVIGKDKKRKKYIFPTPSLRQIIPENIREIQKENRIHVLPEELLTVIDPALIPKIAVTPAQKYIDVLAGLVGCSEYKSSMAEYWFLDTMANLLRRAQEDGLDRPTQAILMMWFCEWMKEMQHYDAADRERMMTRFKGNMMAAATTVAKDEQLPTPSKAGVAYNRDNISMTASLRSLYSEKISRDHQRVSFPRETKAYECSLQDLVKITHYIFDLFSTDYQYDLVRSVFTFTPEYINVDVPHQLRTPKKLYPMTSRARGLTPKKRKETDKHEDTQTAYKGYNALMALKLKEYIEITEREEKERQEWKKKSHILPLNFAKEPTFLDKYWPPPPKSPTGSMKSIKSVKTGRKGGESTKLTK